MKKIKIQILNTFTSDIIFEYEKRDNTIMDTLMEAIKSGVNLHSADLHKANLGYANLSGANLGYANLYCAYLHNANLSGANLGYANLYCADLYDANIRDAKGLSSIPMACPQDGSFIGWNLILKNLS